SQQCFERVLGTFEAARAFLLTASSICDYDPVLASRLYRLPIPTPLQRSLLDPVDSGHGIAATLFWRLYHLHRLLHWARALADDCLEYWTQLYIDSHLPLWCAMQQYNAWSDDELLDRRSYEIVPRKPIHPLSAENFAERTRYIFGTAHH